LSTVAIGGKGDTSAPHLREENITGSVPPYFALLRSIINKQQTYCHHMRLEQDHYTKGVFDLKKLKKQEKEIKNKLNIERK